MTPHLVLLAGTVAGTVAGLGAIAWRAWRHRPGPAVYPELVYAGRAIRRAEARMDSIVRRCHE